MHRLTELDAAMVEGDRDPHASSASSVAAIASAVIPNSEKIRWYGADAPKWSMPIIALAYRSQPRVTPASTATRTSTDGGRTESW